MLLHFASWCNHSNLCSGAQPWHLCAYFSLKCQKEEGGIRAWHPQVGPVHTTCYPAALLAFARRHQNLTDWLPVPCSSYIEPVRYKPVWHERRDTLWRIYCNLQRPPAYGGRWSVLAWESISPEDQGICRNPEPPWLLSGTRIRSSDPQSECTVVQLPLRSFRCVTVPPCDWRVTPIHG